MIMTCKVRTSFWVLMGVVLFSLFSSFNEKKVTRSPEAAIRLTFINTVKGSRIVYSDSTYTNSFGERYLVTKLRYYITNISVQKGDKTVNEKNSYHLIDESKTASQVISFSVPQGDYNSLQFLLGVDSLHNVSGAQTGDLDPANDMFWTWNTGYVMAKMEGNSPDSKLVNNKFEFHIGGFSGPYNVLKNIRLTFPKTFHLTGGTTCKIVINADINYWWQHPHDIKIAEHANITSPGQFARELSDNYANMFHIEKISSEDN
jgi:hypothetical protein